MAVDPRILQLAAAQLPQTTGGFDMKAVAQALAGAPALPAVYGYGLRPDEVQAEARAGDQARSERMQTTLHSVQQANAQEEEKFNRIMKAHSAMMDEKRVALAGAAHSLERERLGMAREEWNMRKAGLERDLATQKMMDGLTVRVNNPNEGKALLDPEGRPQLDSNGLPMTEGKFREIPMNVARSMGMNLSSELASQQDMAGKSYKFAAQNALLGNYINQGYDPGDAQVLASDKVTGFIQGLPKYLAAREKEAKNPLTGAPEYRIGGKPVPREQFVQQQAQEYFQGLKGMISDKALQQLMRQSSLTSDALTPSAIDPEDAAAEELFKLLRERQGVK